MADGTRKPIKAVAIGDTVIATDPDTGETGPRAVTALIKGDGDKQLVDITLDTDGPTGTKTGTITATDGHPFWVPALHQWVNAGDLTAGQWLQTSAGTWVQITAVQHRTQTTSVYNLTVNDLHTYYVLAAGTAVLVHNSTCILGITDDIGRYTRARPGVDFGDDILNLRGTMKGPRGGKGVGAWTWTRNKRFIDDALANGKTIRLVTDPTKVFYEGANGYQRELRYLRDKGYGWQKVGQYWEVVRLRP
jgi:hypothetical protein